MSSKSDRQFTHEYQTLATESGIDRPAMNQKQFEEEFGTPGETIQQSSLRKKAKKVFAGCIYPCTGCVPFWSSIVSFIPILGWLPKYNIRENLVCDIIGGVTTGIMHVPQGLAYSVLAGVDPVYGLYSSCFPAFFYMIFGTSRHTSIGSFAVITLMAGLALDDVSELHGGRSNGTMGMLSDGSPLSGIQIASSLTFSLGILQFGAGLLRFEFLTAYFSDPLVSGFTTGAAVHVLIAQIDDIFGIHVPKSSGPLFIFKRAYAIITGLPELNPAAVVTSVLAMSFLLIGKELVNPQIKKRAPGFRFPIPYELILVIVATAASYFVGLREYFEVPVVGLIPTGLPSVSLPVWEILPDCLVQSLGMAVVTVAVHISMAKMIAKKKEYSVDCRQELYALGMTGMLSGLFPVYAPSTALGRTMVNVASGTKTQLSTIFSCTLLAVLFLWMGPLLRELPMCILASIITVALKGMFERCEELRTLWRIDKIDFAIWMVSFWMTVIINVIEGLTIALLFALLTVIFRSQWPRWERVMGSLRGSSSSASLPCSPRATICVFRFGAPLLFTNVERFSEKCRLTIDEWDGQAGAATYNSPRVFIFDFAGIAFIDYMGVRVLSEVVAELSNRSISVFLAAVSPDVLRVLSSHGLLDELSKEHIFPTLHDALAIADRNTSAAEMLFDAREKQLSAVLPLPTLPPSGAAPARSPTLPSTPTSALPNTELLFPSTESSNE